MRNFVTPIQKPLVSEKNTKNRQKDNNCCINSRNRVYCAVVKWWEIAINIIVYVLGIVILSYIFDFIGSGMCP